MEWWWLLLAFFLYFVAAAIIFAEILVPSGGLLSVCAAIVLVAATAILFNHSMIMGVIGIAFAAVMVPVVVIYSLKILPKTKVGKAVFLKPSERTVGDAIPDTEGLMNMLNTVGTVISPLRPVGMVDFDGKRVECVAETGYVEKDIDVTVIKVEGTQLTVRVNK